jgi:hypothetical protein
VLTSRKAAGPHTNRLLGLLPPRDYKRLRVKRVAQSAAMLQEVTATAAKSRLHNLGWRRLMSGSLKASSFPTISDSALPQSRSIRRPLRADLPRLRFQCCLDGIL